MYEPDTEESAFDLVCASVRLCSGLRVHAVSTPDLTRFIRLRMHAGISTHIVTVNPEIEQTMYDDPEYAAIVRKSDVRTCDGVGVQLAARMRRSVVPPRATGVALTEALMEAAAEEGWSVMTVGATDAVRMRFESQIARRGVRVVAGASPPVTAISAVAARVAPLIRERTVVLVALGVPKQDLFIGELRRRCDAIAVYIGVGGTIDYLTGEVRYAPAFVRRAGFEWLFRLLTQPRKRLRRQLNSLPRFALREVGAAVAGGLRWRAL